MTSVESQNLVENGQYGNNISEDIRINLEQIFSKIFLKETSFEHAIYFQPLFNASHELPIDSIVKAPCVRSVLSDDEQLRNAVLTSKSFHVWNDMVRSAIPVKLEQNTLILRDISSTAPSGEIIAIFTNAVSVDGQPCPSAQSVRADMNDTWFVTFSSEENAKAALAAIKYCKYNGCIIRARLKTESSLKSYFSVPSGGNNPLHLNTDLHQTSGSGPNSVVSTPTARSNKQMPLSSSGAGIAPGAPLDGPPHAGQFGMGPPPYGNPALFFPTGYPVPPPPHHQQFMQGFPVQQLQQIQLQPQQQQHQQQQLTPQQQQLLMQQQHANMFAMQMPVAAGSMLPMLSSQQMLQHQQHAFMYMQANPAHAAAYLAMQQQQQVGGLPFVLNPQALNNGGGMVNASPQGQSGKGNYVNNRREGGKFNSNSGRTGGNGNYSQQGGHVRNGNGQPFRSHNSNNSQQQHQQQQRSSGAGGFTNFNSQGHAGPGGPFIARSYSADSPQGNERQFYHTQTQVQQPQQQNFNRSQQIAPTIATNSLSANGPPVIVNPARSETSSDVTDVSKQTGSSAAEATTGGRSPKSRQPIDNIPKQVVNSAKSTASGNRPGQAVTASTVVVDSALPVSTSETAGVVAAGSSKPSGNREKVAKVVEGTAPSSGEGARKPSSAGTAANNGEGGPRSRQQSGARDGFVKTAGKDAPSGIGKEKRPSTGARDSRGKRDSGAPHVANHPVAKKVPVVEFNMEADFPILIENEVGAAKSNPPTASVWGLANTLKKVTGTQQSAVVEDAPVAVSSSSGNKGKGGKGGAKDSLKAPVQVEVVAAQVIVPQVEAPALPIVVEPSVVDVSAEQVQRKQDTPRTAVIADVLVVTPAVPVVIPAVIHAAAATAERVQHASTVAPIVCPVASAEVHLTTSCDTHVPAIPASQVHATVGVAAPSHVEEVSSPSTWGAKKSFVDILRHASK